jgi:hypothetical protein
LNLIQQRLDKAVKVGNITVHNELELVVDEHLFRPRIGNFENPALSDGRIDLTVCGIGQVSPPDNTGLANRDINKCGLSSDYRTVSRWTGHET